MNQKKNILLVAIMCSAFAQASYGMEGREKYQTKRVKRVEDTSADRNVTLRKKSKENSNEKADEASNKATRGGYHCVDEEYQDAYNMETLHKSILEIQKQVDQLKKQVQEERIEKERLALENQELKTRLGTVEYQQKCLSSYAKYVEQGRPSGAISAEPSHVPFSPISKVVSPEATTIPGQQEPPQESIKEYEEEEKNQD